MALPKGHRRRPDGLGMQPLIGEILPKITDRLFPLSAKAMAWHRRLHACGNLFKSLSDPLTQRIGTGIELFPALSAHGIVYSLLRKFSLIYRESLEDENEPPSYQQILTGQTIAGFSSLPTVGGDIDVLSQPERSVNAQTSLIAALHSPGSVSRFQTKPLVDPISSALIASRSFEALRRYPTKPLDSMVKTALNPRSAHALITPAPLNKSDVTFDTVMKNISADVDGGLTVLFPPSIVRTHKYIFKPTATLGRYLGRRVQPTGPAVALNELKSRPAIDRPPRLGRSKSERSIPITSTVNKNDLKQIESIEHASPFGIFFNREMPDQLYTPFYPRPSLHYSIGRAKIHHGKLYPEPVPSDEKMVWDHKGPAATIERRLGASDAPVTDRGTPLGVISRTLFQRMMPQLDLNDVRIHTGSAADRLNRAHNAKALSFGADILFRAGQFNPLTSKGLALLGHELVHVLQFKNAGGTIFSGNRSKLEQQAKGAEQTFALSFESPTGRVGQGAIPMASATAGSLNLLHISAASPAVPRTISAQESIVSSAPASQADGVVGNAGEQTPLKAEEAVNNAPVPAQASASADPEDMEELSRKVLRIIERRLLTERERRGIDRWAR